MSADQFERRYSPKIEAMAEEFVDLIDTPFNAFSLAIKRANLEARLRSTDMSLSDAELVEEQELFDIEDALKENEYQENPFFHTFLTKFQTKLSSLNLEELRSLRSLVNSNIGK